MTANSSQCWHADGYQYSLCNSLSKVKWWYTLPGTSDRRKNHLIPTINVSLLVWEKQTSNHQFKSKMRVSFIFQNCSFFPVSKFVRKWLLIFFKTNRNIHIFQRIKTQNLLNRGLFKNKTEATDTGSFRDVDGSLLQKSVC